MPFETNPKESNFSIVQGDSFSMQLVYKDSNGTPINLSGFSPILEVRDKPGGKILCASASLNNGITITSASSGTMDILLSGSLTSNFTIPKAAYQFKINSSSTSTTLLYGWFLVEKSVIE